MEIVICPSVIELCFSWSPWLLVLATSQVTHFYFLFSHSFLSNITQIQDEFVRIIPTVSEIHPERLVALSFSFRHFAEGICMF